MRKISAPLKEFFEGLEQLTETRSLSGLRYPVAPVLRLVVTGLLCGQWHPTAIAQFGKANTRLLWRGLGFRREQLPSRWTISRVLAAVSMEELSEVFLQWMSGLVKRLQAGDSFRPLAFSVDGKAAKGSKGEGERALMMLNVFAHELEVAVAGWPISDKEAETTELRKRLATLCEHFPGLALLVGDAHFANRPLCEAIVALNRDYFMRVKGNQPQVQEALATTFAEESARPADEQETEKKGAYSFSARSG